MESLLTSHPKLSAALSNLLRKSQITSAEHEHFLRYIESENHFREIEETHSQDELEIEVFKLVRSWHKPTAVVISNSTSTDESSSPLGTFLHEKKKRQHAEHELKLSLATTDIDSITESHEDH